jgi:general secretion pathway protein H
MRREPYPARPGFTLVEICVVLAILAVALLALPGRMLPGLRGRAGAAAALRLADDLAATRAAALAEGGMRELRIDPGGRFYRVGGQSRALPDGARLAGSGGAVWFFADGSARGGPVSLTDGGRVWRISIDALSGRIAWRGPGGGG